MITQKLKYKPEELVFEANLELARRRLFYFCNLMYPVFFREERTYLVEMCDDIQEFIENSDKHILIINLPPRHGKSFTATSLSQWLFGRDPLHKVMTGSYNETLSSNFARQVRNSIDNRKAGKKIVYHDVFPDTKIKKGEASSNIWALEGSEEKSYLATSPTGTATGFGANTLIIDDVIKNSDEAYNENVLEKHFDWFANTMLSRLEGDDFKIIIIMTRWAKGDLAGRIIDAYPDDVQVITFKALQDDGTMLCDEVLNHKNYMLKTREMNNDIVQANYNQVPIDIKGVLYPEFKVYDTLPPNIEDLIVYNITDTADTGSDNLCSIDFVVHDGNAYIINIEYTDESMEITEPKVAQMLYDDNVNNATFESNNGGRGFARNIERILKEVHNTNKITIKSVVQTKNKEARILTSSAWVAEHVFMPFNWKNRFNDFFKEVTSYQRKGKNAHDDGVDVLASIYEQLTGKIELTIQSKSDLGLSVRHGSKKRKGYWG